MKASYKFLGAAISALVLGFGVAAAPAFAGTNLIADGDFSQPNVSGSWVITNATPWSNANDVGVEIGYSPIYGLPCDNTQCQNLEVNANTFGDVSQTVNGLTPGQEYTVSFDYGGRNAGGPSSMDFLVNGTQVLPTISGSIGAWTAYTYTFAAPGSGSADIEFSSLQTGQPSYGNEITNVSLAAVPEPATWAMLILGVAMIGFAARRRSEGLALAA